MLKHLFGSKTRVKLLSLFLANPQKVYYVRELTRKLDERINSIRRELDNLLKLGLLESKRKKRKKYFKVNSEFILFSELRALILKEKTAPASSLTKQIKTIGNIKYALLSGKFVQPITGEVDLFLVGNVNRRKLNKLIKTIEKNYGQEINYTIMTTNEFKYRKDLKDKFLEEILNKKHLIIINKFKKN